LGLTPELYDFVVKIVDDRIKTVRVVREEFDRLVAAVEGLAKAQRSTEERLGTVIEEVRSLAEAQKRTELRLNELAEAQKRTELRLNELAEAQKRTELRLNELAEAQKRTEDSMRSLSISVSRLSDVIGYGLEDVARVVLPGWLERHLDVYVETLERRFVEVTGKEVELNLYGEGMRKGEKVTVVGEVMARIYGRDVEEFASKVENLTDKNILKVMFGFLIHPTAEKVAKEKDIILVASYMK